MKVLFDHQIFEKQTFGGISRYFYELIRAFTQDGDIDVGLSLYFSNNGYIRSARFSHHRTYLPGIKIGFDTVVRHLTKKNLKYSKRALQAQDFDILHPTYYDPYFLDYVQNKPFVLTIHDMTHEIHPELFSPTDTDPLNKRRLAEKSRKIIAISESTKNDIVRLLGISEDKIEVIGHGPPFDVDEAARVDADGYDFPERFILFVGERYLYKNFERFIRAAAPALQKDKTLRVICAGGKEFDRNEKALLETLRIGNRVLRLKIDDHMLIAIYKRALFLVFPSLYEGFGLPILEAFSCGCPVALSRTGSFPEVAGDAGVYFDPTSVDDMEAVIFRLTEDRTLRPALASRGYEHLKRFSWKTTADKTAALYRSIVS